MSIPLDKMTGVIWYNGQIIDWQSASIHVLTHGLHYGSSVFEGVRVYNSKPFMLKEHIARLHHSANTLGFKITYSIEQLCDAAIKQIAMNNIKDGYMRPIAWRGSDTMLIGGGRDTAEVAIAVWGMFEDARSAIRQTGAKLTISKWKKPAPEASPYSAKAASIYTVNTMVKNEAEMIGFNDAVMLDGFGNITEASTSNIFFIKGNELYTPLPDCFLNGITRQTIIKLAKELGIKVHEVHIKPSELPSYDAAFLTGTAIEIMPIKSLDAVEFEHPNKLAELLAGKYKELTIK